jgi:hypothetical protein
VHCPCPTVAVLLLLLFVFLLLLILVVLVVVLFVLVLVLTPDGVRPLGSFGSISRVAICPGLALARRRELDLKRFRRAGRRRRLLGRFVGPRLWSSRPVRPIGCKQGRYTSMPSVLLGRDAFARQSRL